jgi:hypothetical protein
VSTSPKIHLPSGLVIVPIPRNAAVRMTVEAIERAVKKAREEGIAVGAASAAWRPLVDRLSSATAKIDHAVTLAASQPALLTWEQAASLLSISVRALKARVERGLYQKAIVKTGGKKRDGKRGGNGGSIRFRRSELEEGR